MDKLTFLPVVGVVLFLAVLSSYNLGVVAAALAGARIDILALFLLFHIPVIMLKAWKWQRLLGLMGYRFRLGQALTSWLGGFAISLLTPGRIGDFARAYQAEKEFKKIGKPLLGVAVDRLIDVLLLLVFGALGAVFFAVVLQVAVSLLWVVVALLLALLGGLAAATRKGAVAFILKPLMRKLLPKKYRADASLIFADFYEGVALLLCHKRALACAVGIGVGYWLLTIGQFVVLAGALNLPVAAGYLFLVIPLMILVDTLPISFAGLGTREALLILLFSVVGLSAEQAISYSLLVLVLGYLPPGLAGFAVWMRRPGDFVPRGKGNTL